MRILAGYIIWALFIWYEVSRNYKLIEVLKERPNYVLSFGIRAFFGFICLTLMVPYGTDPFLELYDLIVYVVPLILNDPTVRVIINLSCLFYLVFDPWLNKKRGLKWYYRGEHSGMLDKLKLGAYYALKILCLVGFIYTTYVGVREAL